METNPKLEIDPNPPKQPLVFAHSDGRIAMRRTETDEQVAVATRDDWIDGLKTKLELEFVRNSLSRTVARGLRERATHVEQLGGDLGLGQAQAYRDSATIIEEALIEHP